MTKLASPIRQQLAKLGVKIECEVGEVEIRYKRKFAISSDVGTKITCSNDAHKIFRRSFQDGQIEHREFFKIMTLSRQNKVLSVSEISAGGISGTVADPKVIFQTALMQNASCVMLCHNHPSGNLKPSQADMNLTKKMKESGKMLELPVLDHIILSEDSYLSFVDDGIF